ncbi:MAG: hypothetical protein CVU55_08750 [Deltaproteobacteria bacterium HGW-Deltaproteobacteria-13]|jgi:2',3'-cyclic-nucleotide 2'-phosphodiesterase (5'-nucleotidase family)|nr:MAG: hypothetical protein CVU55_08750 [Deltaproteobacteria bacterium HGW-Deltaproteobacteria-13]
MKRFRVLLAIAVMLTLSLMIAGCGSSSGGGSSTDNTVSLTILETSDVHDHAGGYGSAASYSPMTTGNDTVLGGYARLATYISDVKNQKGANNVLLCDSGDFTMGTVYTMTLASASPLSFMFFSIMGYDAITIGNHEVELGPNALYSFISNAQANTTYPFSTPIIASNMNTHGHPINGKIVTSKIIEKAGIKIGILGRMGTNAVFDAPMATPLTFSADSPGTPDDAASYAALQAQVDDLRNNQGAQFVVLLSHEGFTNSGGVAVGNDANLAEAVSGIDVILSGHLHINQTALKTSANTHNTILVEPGAYGEHIARLDLKIDKTTGKVTSYTSINPIIDDTIIGDSWMNYVVGTEVNSALNTALAPAFTGLGLTGVASILDTVAINDAPINDTSITSGYTVGESVLGNLAADSYRTAINGIWAQAYAGSGGNVTYANTVMTAATGDANRVQIAFVPGGVIRDPLAVEDGTISFADLYNVVPLGADPLDSTAFGYPLLTTYIKALDIYKAVGISLLMGSFQNNGDYYINFSGIYVHVIAWPSTFQVYLCPTDTNTSSPNYGMNGNLRTGVAGTLINPGDTVTTYKIAVDLYTLYMMYAVAAINPAYTIYTYNAAGTTVVNATGNRVWTSGSTTMRPWQAMEAWSWAAGAHATSNLSNAGYYTAYPYPRVY